MLFDSAQYPFAGGDNGDTSIEQNVWFRAALDFK